MNARNWKAGELQSGLQDDKARKSTPFIDLWTSSRILTFHKVLPASLSNILSMFLQSTQGLSGQQGACQGALIGSRRPVPGEHPDPLQSP